METNPSSTIHLELLIFGGDTSPDSRSGQPVHSDKTAPSNLGTSSS